MFEMEDEKMIKEKITGNKKNLAWWRKRLMNDTQIELISISDFIPVKEREGTYFLFARYNRKVRNKRKSGW